MLKLKSLYQILGALIGCFALCLQFYLTVSSAPEYGLTYLQGIIKFFSFMTILTNILVTLTYLIPLLAPNSNIGLFFNKPIVQSGVLVYILIVGIAYHFLLAHLWNPTGLGLIADDLLHYAVPVLYLIYWIFFVDKGTQQFINCIKWLIYPFIYIIYSLIRGELSGQYPYPFVDVKQLGYASVVKNVFFLMLAYIFLGLIIIFFDKLLSKIFKKKSFPAIW